MKTASNWLNVSIITHLQTDFFSYNKQPFILQSKIKILNHYNTLNLIDKIPVFISSPHWHYHKSLYTYLVRDFFNNDIHMIQNSDICFYMYVHTTYRTRWKHFVYAHLTFIQRLTSTINPTFYCNYTIVSIFLSSTS